MLVLHATQEVRQCRQQVALERSPNGSSPDRRPSVDLVGREPDVAITLTANGVRQDSDVGCGDQDRLKAECFLGLQRMRDDEHGRRLARDLATIADGRRLQLLVAQLRSLELDPGMSVASVAGALADVEDGVERRALGPQINAGVDLLADGLPGRVG